MVPRESASKEWYSCRLRPSTFCPPPRLRSKLEQGADWRHAGNPTGSPPLRRPVDAGRADRAVARARGAAGRGDAAGSIELAGLVKSKLPFFVSVAELDPPNIIGFAETLKSELCKAGDCPTYMVFKDHSHISEVMSPDTADDSVTGPILKWMKSVK